MRIRAKIMLGFLIPAVMLAAAGAFSIYELKAISSSVQSLLDDNYRSITAAKQMIEALEREDSGMLLLLSGNWKQGRQTIRAADEKFRQALQTAENNITVKGEKKHVENIRTLYRRYSGLWDRPIAGTENQGNLGWYFEDVHDAFRAVKAAVQDLMSANDKAMYETASDLKNRAHRAVMPLAVAILAALVFVLLFHFFINIYIVNPILSIIGSIERFVKYGDPVAVKVDTEDEIADLAASVSNLAAMVKNTGRGSGY